MDPHFSDQPESIDIWVVEKRLGAGGMGTVYRCHNRDAPKIKAAIKVLANHLQASDTVRRRFIREAELLFELEHPHIVKVRNIRMDAAPPFIEMSFVNGVPLSQILKKGPLPPREAARITAQVASALAHCHARGVRHRDVKPANINVRDGNATLVDFGVAINVQGTLSQGHRGGSLGTLSYTPPEWGGRGVEPTAWDAYALGLVLREGMETNTGYPMTGGTMSYAGTSPYSWQDGLCDTDLYFSTMDRDGGMSDCSLSTPQEHTYGPSWNTKNLDGCPFDDPGETGALGPQSYEPGIEHHPEAIWPDKAGYSVQVFVR